MVQKYSKNLKFLALLLPILGIVVISGCTTPGGGAGTGNGVAILNWEPDFPQVESGDDVRFYLRVQNLGTEEATNVKAKIINIDSTEWQLSSVKVTEDLGDLSPPNPVYGTPGEEKTHYWGGKYSTLKAPQLPEGLMQTFNPVVRVYYQYRTTAIKPITLVNEDELRKLIQEGKSLPTSATTTSAGPLAVSVITGTQIKAPEGWTGSREFPITVTIDNVGGGRVGSEPEFGISTREDDEVKVKIELPSGLSFADPDCNQYGFGEDVLLWKGQHREISCDITITDTPDVSEEKTILVTLEYDYYIQRSTSITVKGTETATGYW